VSATLEANRIPAAPIIEVIRTYLDEEGERIGDGLFAPMTIRTLSYQSDLKEDMLSHILRGRAATIDFDVADRLLVVMDKHHLWYTDLADVYQSARIADEKRHFVVETVAPERRCEKKGCSNTFPVTKKRGGHERRFCSTQCRRSAAEQRKREREGKKLRYSNPNDKCVHGHEWTEENTLWAYSVGYAKPRRRCKACTYARNEEARKRRLAAKRKQRGAVNA